MTEKVHLCGEEEPRRSCGDVLPDGAMPGDQVPRTPIFVDYQYFVVYTGNSAAPEWACIKDPSILMMAASSADAIHYAS